jgi:hypothetical protein
MGKTRFSSFEVEGGQNILCILWGGDENLWE